MTDEKVVWNKKWILIPAAIIAFAWMVLFAVSSSATSISDKVEGAQQSVEQSQNRLENSREQVEEMEEAKNQLEGKMAVLNKELSSISSQLESSTDELEQIRKSIEKTQLELEKAEKVEDGQYESMKKRIQFMYENGMTDMLDVIVSENDFTQMLNKAEFFAKMTEYDRKMLEEYTRVKGIIASSKSDLEKKEKEMESVQKDVEMRQSQVNHLVQETANEIARQTDDLEAAEARALEYEKKLEEEQNTLEALKQREAEEKAILEAKKALEEEKRRQEEARKAQQQQAAESSGSDSNGNEGASDSNKENNNISTGQTTVNFDSENKVVGQGSDKNLQTDKDGYEQAASTSDLKLLATIIYCEAGNQPYEGKVAVGSVVMNRINSPLFPGNMLSVLYQKNQFTPVMSGRFAVVLAKDGATDECYAAARDVLGGANNVPDCLFFRTVIPGKEGTIIGDHVFY